MNEWMERNSETCMKKLLVQGDPTNWDQCHSIIQPGSVDLELTQKFVLFPKLKDIYLGHC